MPVDITEIVIMVIGLCAVILTIFVIPAIKAKYGQDKVDEALAVASKIDCFIRTFVEAAEQIFPKEEGVRKKEYVTNLVLEKLAEIGVTMDLEQISAAIESAVFELHTKLKN